MPTASSRTCSGSTPSDARGSASPTTSILTFAVPSREHSISRAALYDRSMMRPRVNGPRSLIFTTTDLPFSRFSTRTFVPNGHVRWAAVSSNMLYRSPLAVWFPW